MLSLIFAHFISDFVCQSDEMALKKSKSNIWLLYHCLVYTFMLSMSSLFMAIFLPVSIPFIVYIPLKICVMNGVLHFVVDYFTSRLTTYLWNKDERHWFFVVIGLDQAIHMSLLFLTMVM